MSQGSTTQTHRTPSLKHTGHHHSSTQDSITRTHRTPSLKHTGLHHSSTQDSITQAQRIPSLEHTGLHHSSTQGSITRAHRAPSLEHNGCIKYPMEFMLAADADGGALVEHEGRPGSVRIVGGEGDAHTHQLCSLPCLHCAAALGGLQL